MKIGVLALQGAFLEHIAALKKLGAEAVEVRLPRDLEALDGLIIPGGESTAIGKLLVDYHLAEELSRRIKSGFPIFGTCAGMILLAKQTTNNGVHSLNAMDVVVKRNAFGRQRESFEADLSVPALGRALFHAIFIRAPLIEETRGSTEVLAKLDDGKIVAARQGKLLALAFHPELTDDLRFHRYFLDIVAGLK